MHPSRRLEGAKGHHLDGRRIVLGVSGSIASVEAVRIAHELIRHGADVIPVMTHAAMTMIQPLALEYATGHAPITELTGRGEHVELCGGGKGSADLLLIAPATANTIAKISLGIDDTPLTSCASVAIGAGVPVVVAPAMHEVMGLNPGVQTRLKELEEAGVHIVTPRIEEEKAKVASPEEIADAVIHRLAQGAFAGRNVLVISGSTAEPVDPVRVLTNRSSGRMGVELATAAYRRGANVDLWNAWGAVPLPRFAHVTRFTSVEDLKRLVAKTDLSRYDVILVPAALGDYAPAAAKQKIPSDQGPLDLKLKPLPKILPLIRAKAKKSILVGFKAESDASKLVERARLRLTTYKADFFVANASEAFSAESAEAWIVAATGKPRKISGPKALLAESILDEAAKRLEGKR